MVEYPWMCTLCFPQGKEIKDFGGLSLIYNGATEKYALLGGQGHNGDEIIIFDKTPVPDPYPEILDDDIWKTYEPRPGQDEASDEWEDVIDSLEWKFNAPLGHWLYEKFKELGYTKNPTKEHNIFEAWVYNYLGKLIQQYNV